MCHTTKGKYSGGLPLHRPIVPQLVKKILAFWGKRIFFSVLANFFLVVPIPIKMKPLQISVLYTDDSF